MESNNRKNFAVDRRHHAAMAIMEKFTRHPRSVGETYTEHAAIASGFGVKLVLAGMACLVHAVLPFLFVRTGSAMVDELHERMLARRSFRDHPSPLFERAEVTDATTVPRKPTDRSARVAAHSGQDVSSFKPRNSDGAVLS